MMPAIPDCLARRYQALDELVTELTTNRSGDNVDCCSDDPGVKLMCNFWNILKENPDCDLTEAVGKRMGLHHMHQPRREVTCYMASCCQGNDTKPKQSKNSGCCQPTPKGSQPSCQQSLPSSDSMPLSKVLCNLKEAATVDKACQDKVADLLAAQKELQGQINTLEQREKDGLELLKKADCMWACMEGSYKKKIAESLERQKALLTQMKEIDASVKKWRKNKKDIEFQMSNVAKCQQEIREKTTEKTSDLKCIDMEIADFNKRIQSSKKDIEATNKAFTTKKHASCGRMAFISNEVKRVEQLSEDEKKRKKDKEYEGNKYIKDSRNDLQTICKVLLQKKLENEDMAAEREALQLEIEMLLQTCDQCKDKCRNKQQNVEDEIKALNNEINNFKVRCIRCNECTDTVDIRQYCTDCPRCVNDRNCLLEGNQCSPDPKIECVCMTVKQKLLDNVFENMYTVLERQATTPPGQEVADNVLNCLKKSRNGKLNVPTRKVLQEFILSTVRKNLNLTIVGGAVKTRCEMDKETYNQLMLCLKEIKITKPEKADKATPTKKDPCGSWPQSNECNCPGGAKTCICSQKAPPLPKDPKPCPHDEDDIEEGPGEEVTCPYRGNAPCGPDCAMHTPDCVETEVAEKSNPCCHPQKCPMKNMRAAQCVLGPELLPNSTRAFKSTGPLVPSIQSLGKQKCQCDQASTKPTGSKDTKQLKHKIRKCDKGIRTMSNFPFSDGKKVSFSDTNVLYDDVQHFASNKNFPVIPDSDLPTDNFTKNVISIKNYDTTKPMKSQRELKIESILGRNYDSLRMETGTATDTLIQNNEDIFLNVIAHEAKEQIKRDESKNIETPPGNVTVALDESVVKFIDSKVKEQSDLYVTLKEDNLGFCAIEFSCTEFSEGGKKFTVSRTSSDNMLLNVDREFNKKPYKIKSKKLLKIELSKGALTDLIKSCTRAFKSSGQNKPNCYKSDLCKASIKGLKRVIKEPIALRRTSSGNYDIIINREFENWYKETVKCYKDEEITSLKFKQTDSGECLVSFQNETDSDFKNAFISTSDCGSFKLIIDNKDDLSPSLLSKSSVLSAKFIENVLNKKCAKQCNNVSDKRSLRQKSCSDTNVDQVLKEYLPPLFNSTAPAKLTKTDSGHYTLILDKESKSSFLSKLERCIQGSSKDFAPVKKEESGEVSIALDNVFNLTEFASVSISPSGNICLTLKKNKEERMKTFKNRTNMSTQFTSPCNNIKNVENASTKYVSTSCNTQINDVVIIKSKDNCDNIDKTEITKENDSSDIATELSSHRKLVWDQFIDTIKNPSAKCVSTTCNARNDGCCDVNKCVCKDLHYKSKRWIVEKDSGRNGGLELKDLNVKSRMEVKVYPNNSNNENYNLNSDEKDRRYKGYDNRDIFYPYHIFTCSNFISEVIDLSECPKDHVSDRKKYPVEEMSNKINNNKHEILNEKHKDVRKNKENYYWDSIENLPPQLPSFLADFNCKH